MQFENTAFAHLGPFQGADFIPNGKIGLGFSCSAQLLFAAGTCYLELLIPMAAALSSIKEMPRHIFS